MESGEKQKRKDGKGRIKRERDYILFYTQLSPGLLQLLFPSCRSRGQDYQGTAYVSALTTTAAKLLVVTIPLSLLILYPFMASLSYAAQEN